LKDLPLIVVSRPVPEAAIQLLQDAGRVVVLDVPDPERSAALRAACGEAEALLCSVAEKIDQEFLRAAPRLRLVANMAVGFDNVDLEAARSRGVVVTNTPDVLSETTAEFALALLLATLRRVAEADRLVRSGGWRGWKPDLLVGKDLLGATVGIVGLGRIGGALARRLKYGFQCEILYWGRRNVSWAERELGARRVGKEELLAESEVVSLHLPLHASTRHWLGGEDLAGMRRDSVLINTARGAVVDESALAAALEAGSLWGAGLDVFEDEPLVHPVLLEHPRVVLAPHIGSATEATRTRMAELAARNVVRVLAGEAPLTPVGSS
jgi:glyoxylate reductase